MGSGLESAREWGHIVTVKGHTLAYVVGYQPLVSKTHGYVFAFSLQPGDDPTPGQIIARVKPVEPQESIVRGASFTWNEVPRAKADIEQLAGLFPLKLFTPRRAEGKPHERAV